MFVVERPAIIPKEVVAMYEKEEEARDHANRFREQGVDANIREIGENKEPEPLPPL